MTLWGKRSLALATALLGSVSVLTTAHAFGLSGAWSSQADLCSRVFTKKGAEVTFAESSELFGRASSSMEVALGERAPNARSGRGNRRATMSSCRRPAPARS